MQPHHNMLPCEPLKVEASTCHYFAWQWQWDSEILPPLQTPLGQKKGDRDHWLKILYVLKLFELVNSGIWWRHTLIQPHSFHTSSWDAARREFQICQYWFCKLSVTWTSKPASRALAQWHAAIPSPKQSCCCALGDTPRLLDTLR